MQIKTKILENGISIDLQRAYNLIYPNGVWNNLSSKTKNSIRDNLTYSKISAYSAFLYNKILFQNDKPFLKEFLDKSAILDFPRFGDEDNISTKKLIADFNEAEIIFSNDDSILPEEKSEIKEGAVMGISFGKDSLLSYGIAKEIDLPTKLIFVKDFSDMEWFHKEKLIKKFEKNFKEKIVMLLDETDDIHRDNEINKTDSSAIFGSNAMNGYMIMFLPFAYHFGLNHIVFGNEQNFNDYFISAEGYKCYPSYEQSSFGMIEQNNALSLFTKNKIDVISLIEPLYNIAEVKVLFNRYPEIASYQMSCSHDDYENKDNRWCYKCPMCAKAFLYLTAVGKDPKSIAFNTNFFDKSYTNLYPLFSTPKRTYEKPGAVRDEQLFAFYLSLREGSNGYLIDRFKKELLDEAKEREDELYKKFFGIHKAYSIPPHLRKEILPIYKEELSNG